MNRLTVRDKDTGTAYLYNEVGVLNKAIDKLAEYEDAEKDNRLIVLPCKPGDTVFEIAKISGDDRFMPFVNAHTITSINTSWGKKGRSVVFYWEGALGTHTCKLSDFGKTIFLSREDAENAIHNHGVNGDE